MARPNRILKTARKLAIVILIFCTLVQLTSCGAGGSAKYIIPLYSADKRMDICAWEGPMVLMQSFFDEVAECGFNVLIPTPGGVDFGTNPDKATKYMDMAHEAGLKVIVADTKLVNSAFTGTHLHMPSDPSNTHYYIDHPAFYRFHVCDEPAYGTFEFVKRHCDAVKQYLPGKLPFVNINVQSQPGIFKEYMDVVGPDILSYDNYVLFENRKIRDTWFTDLETVAIAARDTGALTNNIIQAQKNKDGDHNGSGYADPGLYGLRWQIYTSMAYGFQSITYYSYCPTLLPMYGYEPFITSNGERTYVWYNAQKANLELLNFDHVFMNFNWIGASALEPKDSINYMLKFLKDSVPIKKIEGIKDVSVSRDVILGIFEDNENNKGFMLSNAASPFDELEAFVTVKFDKKYKGVQVYGKDDPVIIDLDKKNTAVIKLEPGEGKFIIPLVKGKK